MDFTPINDEFAAACARAKVLFERTVSDARAAYLRVCLPRDDQRAMRMRDDGLPRSPLIDPPPDVPVVTRPAFDDPECARAWWLFLKIKTAAEAEYAAAVSAARIEHFQASCDAVAQLIGKS